MISNKAIGNSQMDINYVLSIEDQRSPVSSIVHQLLESLVKQLAQHNLIKQITVIPSLTIKLKIS